jgi:hypothetical protein
MKTLSSEIHNTFNQKSTLGGEGEDSKAAVSARRLFNKIWIKDSSWNTDIF